MKLAISNIAWDKDDNIYVYTLMKKYGFSGLEVAPIKVVQSIEAYYLDELKEFKSNVASFGINCIAMQSLLYGRNDLELFKNGDILFEYIKKIISIGETLGIRSFIFGSPKNRIIPDNMGKVLAFEIAKKFFTKIGDYLHEKNMYMCIEPNPSVYGGNFLCGTGETLDFVKYVNHENIKLHLDLGTILINNEDLEVVKICVPYITHFHISEPFLEPIIKRDILKQIFGYLEGYKGYISIEMKSTTLDNIEQSLKLISNINNECLK